MSHRHRWKIVGVEPYMDFSFGHPGVDRTTVREVCIRCQKPNTREIDGQWSPRSAA